MNKLLSFSLTIIFFFLSSCEIIDLRRGEKWVAIACSPENINGQCDFQSFPNYYVYFYKNGEFKMENKNKEVQLRGKFTENETNMTRMVKKTEGSWLGTNAAPFVDDNAPAIRVINDTLELYYVVGFAPISYSTFYIKE